MNKINLQDIVGGQLQAKFERSFEKVIENLQDPNTSFQKSCKRAVVRGEEDD